MPHRFKQFLDPAILHGNGRGVTACDSRGCVHQQSRLNNQDKKVELPYNIFLCVYMQTVAQSLNMCFQHVNPNGFQGMNQEMTTFCIDNS